MYVLILGYALILGPVKGQGISDSGKEPNWFNSVVKFRSLHNGGNDPHKRQSQLWDQITCQTKTG